MIDSQRVYNMRMSRVNVYLPDDLAEEAKKAGLNISSLTQEAIRSSLAALTLERWQQQVSKLPSPGVSHAKVIDAVKSAKDELESG
jgi:post-segregation antitoxin (ccd killing protein)